MKLRITDATEPEAKAIALAFGNHFETDIEIHDEQGSLLAEYTHTPDEDATSEVKSSGSDLGPTQREETLREEIEDILKGGPEKYRAQEIEVTIPNVEPEIDVSTLDRVDAEKWYDEEDYPESVEVAKDILEDTGYAVFTRRALADPAEAILDVAEEIGADWLSSWPGAAGHPSGRSCSAASLSLSSSTPRFP